MEKFEKKRWYFKNGSCFEEYTVLYQDESFILVKSDVSGKYSFGTNESFGTLYGFGVDDSYLSLNDLRKRLRSLIRIDKKYVGKTGGQAERDIKRWKGMLSVVESL